MKNIFKVLFPIIFAILIHSGCVNLPDEIIPPQWDVDLNVPIINRSYLMSDIIDENQNIYPGAADSIYIIESDNYNVNSGIASRIEIENESVMNDVVVDAKSDTQTVLILFPENIELDSAVFSSGFLHYSVYNPTSDIVYLSLEIPGISKNGSVLVVNRTVFPMSYDSSSQNLEGYKYNFPASQPPSLKRYLLVNPTITSSNKNDSVICDFKNSNFQFSSVTGKIGRRSLGNFNEKFSLKLGDAIKYRDKIFLKEASLDFSMKYASYYNSFFKAGLKNLQVIGRRNGGQTLNLSMRDGTSLDILLRAQKSEIVFNELNSNINEFLTFLPDEIEITAEHIINPDDENLSFTITNRDTIKYGALFRSRGYLALKNIALTDTLEIKIDEGDRKSILDSKAADLTLNFENAIPLTTSFKVVLTDKHFNPLFTLTRNSAGEDSMLINGGEIDLITGDVISPAATFQNISLDADKIRMLANSYYAIVSTTIKTKESSGDPSALQMVPIKVSNWVSIKAYGMVRYHVNPD
ncbi:MAG TPA: hypothetical protein VMT35_03825 [Ignavibacteriaceae bacterium]|nr:hypothetical protein [Ignavibacteriaceae bacterium]